MVNQSWRSEMEKKRELINGYVELLSRYRWQWFATLTFRGYPSVRKARFCFEQWISALERADGGAEFRFAKVTEYGATRDDLHFHLLIGGLRRLRPALWTDKWKSLAGDCQIDKYDSTRPGIAYVCKTLEPEAEPPLELKLDKPAEPLKDRHPRGVTRR